MNYELIIIIVLIAGLFFQYNKLNEIIKSQNNAKDKSTEIEKNVFLDNQDKFIKQVEDEIQHRQELKERDYNVINDPLTPGERRLPSHQYPRKPFKNKINIPTRGHPDNYQYLGNLIRDTDDKILPVFGRQEYPGSDYYEYYLLLNQDGNFGLKLPLNNGKKIIELEEDQVVDINYFKSKEGNFVYKPFDYDVPRYNPYVY